MAEIPPALTYFWILYLVINIIKFLCMSLASLLFCYVALCVLWLIYIAVHRLSYGLGTEFQDQ